MTADPIAPDVVARMVAKSRAASGVPDQLDDPVVARRLAVLLSPTRETTPADTRGRLQRSGTSRNRRAVTADA